MKSGGIFIVLAVAATIWTGADDIHVDDCEQIGIAHGASCYFVNTAVMTWQNHEDHAQSLSIDCEMPGDPCIPLHFHLASILDPTENSFVQSLLTGASWIGLNDIVEQATYVWPDAGRTSHSPCIEPPCVCLETFHPTQKGVRSRRVR